jgi:cob(I)alamin adenosyltransferase
MTQCSVLRVSIVTKKGDLGKTSLMFNRPVSKCDPRVEALGTVDELSAALGLARATAGQVGMGEKLVLIQQDLITLMGELATTEADLARFEQGGFKRLGPDDTAHLEEWIAELESQSHKFKGWALPGANVNSAAIEVARATCRRAERRICALREAGQLSNVALLAYLNRLGDLLWLLARRAERDSEQSQTLGTQLG